MDMPTRWGSTFQMIKRMNELKEFIQDLAASDCHLTDAQWNKAERLEQILSIPYRATIKLQKDSLTPGECFMEWKRVVFELRY